MKNTIIMNKKTIISLLAALTWICTCNFASGQPSRRSILISPQINPDKTVTFRYLAPMAKDVKLSAQFDKGPVAMTKDSLGLWSVTSGPASPDVIPMYQAYSNELITDIIPFTEKNFRIIADREHRAVAGFSRGGGQTLWAGLSNTDKFAYICSFSAYLTKEAFEQHFRSFYSNPEETNKHMKLFWLTVGNEDFLYQQAADFMDLLKSKKLNTKTMITNGGHTWMNCRLFLTNVVPLLFRD